MEKQQQQHDASPPLTHSLTQTKRDGDDIRGGRGGRGRRRGKLRGPTISASVLGEGEGIEEEEEKEEEEEEEGEGSWRRSS